jgi:hypothetical protein
MVNSNELAPTVGPAKVDDLSWEERTRLAWERIRGGVEAAFNMEPAKQTDDKALASDSVSTDMKALPTQVNQPQQGQPTSENDKSLQKQLPSPEKLTHTTQLPLPSSQRNPISIVHRAGSPPKILRTQSGEMRRVTFGEPQEHIFYDDQDENRSQMTYADPYHRKKKRRFRGTRLISGVLGKVKHTAVNLARSRSTDSQLSAVSVPSSQESDHSNSSRALSDQSSFSSAQRNTNLHPQPQPFNPLRDQNGRFA